MVYIFIPDYIYIYIYIEREREGEKERQTDSIRMMGAESEVLSGEGALRYTGDLNPCCACN